MAKKKQTFNTTSGIIPIPVKVVQGPPAGIVRNDLASYSVRPPIILSNGSRKELQSIENSNNLLIKVLIVMLLIVAMFAMISFVLNAIDVQTCQSIRMDSPEFNRLGCREVLF